ncbi:MAG TPA: COG1615 family transporter, partial [Desulfitobacterium dehalogenans]|nr:COG1615 family transporter [Desulfitobacterium dehalogenans]
IKDVPPATDYQEFQLSQPRIYFGELTHDWVVVNTDLKEFDYPAGGSNAETRYGGKSGIQLTPFNRLMLSIKHGTLRFYLANEINSQSRILLHRNIMDRVEKLVPFLQYDDDPYLVVDEGRLKWIIDAYTVSDTFPYSSMTPEREINYIRNSVKVVVDAYDGTVEFFAVDAKDPILQTYRKIFPGVFKDLSAMSDTLKSHLRYPETLFTIQSTMLKNFHMTDPTVFYNKEDTWDIAKELFTSEPQNIAPYYSVMRLPGSDHPELILMIPFTPSSSSSNTRNNMVAWLAARMDGEYYGELRLYKIPKNSEVDGPLQVELRIDQDPEISKQLALWDQRGSSVIRGNLLVLPIANSFLYVEPIYLQSEKGGSTPEMKRVVVAYGDKIVMSETFEEALAQLFGVRLKLSPPPQANVSAFAPASLDSEEDQEPTTDAEDETQALLKQIEQIREMLNQLELQFKKITGDSSGLEDDKDSDSDFDKSDSEDSVDLENQKTKP